MSDVVLPSNGSNIGRENLKGDTLPGTHVALVKEDNTSFYSADNTAVRLDANIFSVASVQMN